MYAVIESGGKQYRVQPGDIVQVEKLEGDVGSAIKFEQVLFASKVLSDTAAEAKVWLGKPYLSGAQVQAEVVGQGRDEKILIIKMKRRKQYRRTQGHRQFQTQLLITSVDTGAGEKVGLSDADKKAKLGKFHTQLTPKGLASTPKTLGSRVRMARARTEAYKAGTEDKAKAATGTKKASSTKK
ncbi:50S ribosomal protein L21 [Bdellovibrionota bacterium FG-1]